MTEEQPKTYEELLTNAAKHLSEIYPANKVPMFDSVALATWIIHSARQHCDDCKTEVIQEFAKMLWISGEKDLSEALQPFGKKDET